MQALPIALVPLAAYNQFILYKLVPKDNGKTDKLPVDYRTGQVFKQTELWQQNPNAWCDAQTAIDVANTLGDEYGVGFFFTVNDPFYFVDIDNCLLPSGEWSAIALDLIQRLPGAAVEVSQSGTGLHIFATGAVPEHACKNIAAGIELYTSGRFVALTGARTVGSADANNTATLVDVVNYYFPPKVTARGDEWTSEPIEGYTPFADDEKLLKKALKVATAANKFGGKASFADLYSNNATVLAANYPPDASSKELYDGSSADAALAQHLAFWTGCNCDHILNLMWCSKLVRPKWSKHASYLQMTIQRAVSLQEVVYTGNKPRESVTATPPNEVTGAVCQIVQRQGFQFLAGDQQADYFKGCVYIQDLHKILVPGGDLLKSEVFNAVYGGYVFQLDGEASGKVTKKAWEAFTESQIASYPKAKGMCFRPDLEPGAIVTYEGRTLVNIYEPILTPRQKGDATPFLNHLAKVLPDENDRAILLAYMAAIVQHKGVKFQWAPLLQGAEGNGKTLFTRCVAHAIGKRYTHMPKADDIDNKFNGWMLNKLFVGVEDIFVADHRREVVEALKPMITNTDLEIQLKGVDQVTAQVCANFILNMNDKGGFKKTKNDRRFCMFYTAQQSDEDIKRDHMDGNYFPDLYKWLRGDGYAIVADYLDTYEIPEELNPAGACHRAPITSTTDEAIAGSLGGVEQEILEAVEEGRQGFASGWISSMALTRLLEDLRAARRIPPNKRRGILQALGYDYHPALNEGKVNNYVAVDQGKPRLFIKQGHVHLNLTTAAAVTKAYVDAQGVAIGNVNSNKFTQNP